MKRIFSLYMTDTCPVEAITTLEKEWAKTLSEIRRYPPVPQQGQERDDMAEIRKSDIMPIMEKNSFALINLKDRKWPTRAVFSIEKADEQSIFPPGTEYIRILSYFECKKLLEICRNILSQHNYTWEFCTVSEPIPSC